MKSNNEMMIESGVLVYKDYRCKCGCDERLPWNRWQKYNRMPQYKRGHNYKGKNNPNYGNHAPHPWMQGKNNPWYGKYGSEHPAYIDGYGKERRESKLRNLGFIPINKRTREANSPHHIDNKHVLFIPRSLHESIWHSVKTGKNMTIVNALVCEWFDKNKSHCTEPLPQGTLCDY